MSKFEHKRELFCCDCHQEGILVEHFPDDEPEEQIIYFSMWVVRGWNTMWKFRLWHIWHIIRKGYPWVEDIMMSHEDAKRLGQYLLDIEFDQK